LCTVAPLPLVLADAAAATFFIFSPLSLSRVLADAAAPTVLISVLLSLAHRFWALQGFLATAGGSSGAAALPVVSVVLAAPCSFLRCLSFGPSTGVLNGLRHALRAQAD